MQLPPDEQEVIRRAFHVEGKAIRQIERQTGHSRQAIRRAISNKPPVRKSVPSSPFRSAPIFGPFQARVEIFIAQNDHLPRKQRYTSHRIFEIIGAEGYQGCESRVRQHIAAWKEEHHSPELFLPLEFEFLATFFMNYWRNRTYFLHFYSFFRRGSESKVRTYGY